MFEIITFLIAGVGAGLITGLIGASAVMVTAPLLIVFLGYDPYLAIGIALSVDVFSSSSATWVYNENKNLNIKPALILLFSALVAVVLGSFIAVSIPSILLGSVSGLGIILAGASIFMEKRRNSWITKFKILRENQTLALVGAGILVGLNAGILGAGGGLIILFTLMLVLNYDTHEAVGTSVFSMIFIALLGGVVHYINMPFSIIALIVTSGAGILGALISSNLANSFPETVLSKVVGSIVLFLGTMLMFKHIIDLIS